MPARPPARLPGLQVRYQGGTWRVGGLLALSRAFGDAYLKGSLQFEGVAAGSDGYSSGFGLIAEPYTTLQVGAAARGGVQRCAAAELCKATGATVYL